MIFTLTSIGADMQSLFCLVAATLTASAADWEDLLVAGKDSPWKTVDKGWILAADARLESKAGKLLEPVDIGKGNVWINGDKGRLKDLITKKDYRDCEAHVEFLLGKGSNSGIKFHAIYEIQLIDKPTEKILSGDSMGGIYPRAEYNPKYTLLDQGIAPKVNAAKPAGEWQTLDVIWQSPRFNEQGAKIQNAKIVKATLNGLVIHENQDLQHPTGSNYKRKETAAGPFMLQADHGPTAFRNVRIRELKK